MAPLIVITGTSASGKTTILQEVLSRGLVDAIRFVTCTTRAPRPDEVDGKSYWFMTQQAFEQELAAHGFFEHALVYGKYYGSSKQKLEALLTQEKPILIILDVQGAQTVKQLYPHTKIIFIDAPDDMLKRRLESRNPDPIDLAARLQSIKSERRFTSAADIVIESLDGGLEQSVQATADAIRQLS